MRPSSRCGPLDHGGDRGLVGDVGDDRDGLGAALLEFGNRGFRFGFVASDDRDRGAGRGQPARHAEPDAAIAAGHDRDFAGEIEESGVIGVTPALLFCRAGSVFAVPT